MKDSLSLLRQYFNDELNARLSLPTFIALLIGMVLVSDLGLLSTADGAIYSLMLAILLPALTPYLLVAVCTFQDVAGLSMLWWYGGTSILGLLLASRALWRRNGFEQLPPSLLLLVSWTLIVIAYAATTSMLHEYLEGYPQSAGRPPLLVAGLMAGMTIAGVLAAQEIFRDEHSAARLKWLVIILVFNGLFVASTKALFGLEMFASPEGLEQVQEAAQLTEASALGIPRLIGTYLTPNGFALCYGLVLLLLLAQQKRIADQYAIWYAVIGSVLAIASLSKAMMVFFLLTSFVLFSQSRYAKYQAMFAAVFLLGLLVYFSASMGTDSMLQAFRMPMGDEGDLGYRSQAWQLVTHSFGMFDWVFGTGLAYWQVLFEQNLGFSLSDPHTYLLSIPGTYGVLGIALYVMVGVTLLEMAWKGKGGVRAMAWALLVLFFVKDAASIPYLIGNTPLTVLIWMLIAGTFLSGNLSAQE